MDTMISRGVIAEDNTLNILEIDNQFIFEVDGESALTLSGNIEQIDVTMNDFVTFDGSTVTIMDGSDTFRTISSVNQFIFADEFTFYNVTAPLMNALGSSGTLFYNMDTNEVLYSIVNDLNDALSGQIDALPTVTTETQPTTASPDTQPTTVLPDTQPTTASPDTQPTTAPPDTQPTTATRYSTHNCLSRHTTHH